MPSNVVLTYHSTFYQSETWPMKDSADPLAGWSFSDILNIPASPIVNDLYGKLHAHVHERLSVFQKRISSQPLVFTFTSTNAKHLSERSQARFSRIEVSHDLLLI